MATVLTVLGMPFSCSAVPARAYWPGVWQAGVAIHSWFSGFQPYHAAPVPFCRPAGSRGPGQLQQQQRPQQRGGADQPIAFAEQLDIYGGRSAQEELEALSNDSARWAGGQVGGWLYRLPKWVGRRC